MKKEWKKWLKLLIFIPLVLILIGINVYEDPANIFHKDSGKISDALLNGESVYFESGNCDERAIKREMIEKMPKNVACLVIGPSLSLGIDSEDVGEENFYNLSVSGMNYYDYLAILAMLKANGVHADRIILCVDSYFFDPAQFADGSRDPSFMKYAASMADYLNGAEFKKPSGIDFSKINVGVRESFSIAYFQSAVKYIKNNKSLLVQTARWGITDENTECFAHLMSDGSYVYAENELKKTPEAIKEDAGYYPIETTFAYGRHMDENSRKMFVKMVDYMMAEGSEVEFILLPLSPALWNRIENDEGAAGYFILDEIETFANEMAVERGITLYGSFDPNNVGVGDEDFLDVRHLRNERICEYYDL